ncbi:MAG: Dabb family protein [Actinomycetota bacterium]|nr:Dabb family protein [Actinomycetota bacterium]
MIRHVVLLRLNDSATAERVEHIRAALARLVSPGRISFTMGPDRRLRPDNMDVAIVADFQDVDAYLAYDSDPDHDRIRRELIGPITERLERCQFEI